MNHRTLALTCLLAAALFAAPAVAPVLDDVAPVGSAEAQPVVPKLPCRPNPDEVPEIECVFP